MAVTAIVRDDAGRVLMIERADNGLWAVPGGAQDIGETTVQAAVRETREETGIDVEVIGVAGIYSNPRHVIAYDNGEVRQEFSVCFHARPLGGRVTPSTETTRVHWVEPARLATLTISPAVRLRIEHGLRRKSMPHLS